MKVLITGATGLIGKEIGKHLVEMGHQLTVLARSPEKARSELPFPATILKWEGSAAEVPAAAVAEHEVVINLVGESIAGGRWTEERKKKIYDSRILSTRSLVNAIEALPQNKNKLKAFVHGSATGIYGNRGDEVLSESSAPDAGDDFLAHVTRDWEAEADRVSQVAPQVRLTKVRTGIVLARQGGTLPMLLPIFNSALGGKLASGQQWMSWIHIDDITALFVECALNDKMRGAINGTAPEPARNARFTVEFARALGRPVSLPAPKFALKLILGEMSNVVLASARCTPEAALHAGFQFKYPDLVGALRELCEPLKKGQHEFFAEQWVPRKPSEIFPYFSSETNLEELTPPFMGFKVLRKSPGPMKAGTLIDYRLAVHGIPMKWKTRIEEWIPEERFVDNQLRGPYKRWHHTHTFRELAGGTLMTDCVHYRLPLGWLGDVTAHWKVLEDVKSIFAYRRQKVDAMWGAENRSS